MTHCCILPLVASLHVKEHAGTKKQAGNVLALELVTQLYHLGVIEACKAPGDKKLANQVLVL